MDMLPEVTFTVYRNNLEPIEKKAKFINEQIIYSGIEVNEYTKVDVRLSCPFDDDAKLVIDSCFSEDSIEIIESQGNVTIMSGENSPNMLVPGDYSIELSCKGVTYYSYYRVSSKVFSDVGLFNLRTYLENMLKGLSYDLVKQRRGMLSAIPEMNPTLLQVFQFISTHRNQISRNSKLILKEPITNLIGEYRVTNKTKKPDQKSQRWYAKRGHQKVSSLMVQDQYYEKHTKLSLDNQENQWVKYIIYYFLLKIRKLEVNFQKEMYSIKNRIDEQQRRLNQTEETMNKGSNTFGYKGTVKSLRDARRRITGRIEELEKEYNTYSSYKHLLTSTTSIFTELERTPWIQELPNRKPKKVTQKLLKDYRYRRMYSLYNEFRKLETNHNESRNTGIQHRRTWQLFEYYNVGILIDILRENGYKWVQGWLADSDNPQQHIGTLPQDTVLRLEKDNCDHYLELAYDSELETSIVDQSYSRYFNSDGRRPDIRLTIYKQNGKLYSEKAGLIVEVKCRHHRYLINEEIEPDVKVQLKDFKKLEYFDSNGLVNGDPVKTPIKQVIVLYPKQNGKVPVVADHIYGEAIIYLQIEPNDITSEFKPFGYEAFKNNVDNFLSQIKEDGSNE
ncbi:DUF2357 domain-containing protein [Terribacillus saccharophilus]|uniref:DUF2357 domain-containing protein n=1 Tax=Terribacillus saccharophilus TaxID=361277 RepID=A0A268A7S3_9BACI|nr:DUF2357 domain-containing protein [Terribacillus saccharophilus]PAD20173.1 hypothetical protein CHH64_15655 [Terribacillus saccharophilus]